jgi:hypothetical protein
MELIFYREDEQHTIVKRCSNSEILYLVHSPKLHFRKSPTRIYRGPLPFPTSPFAKISKVGHWNSQYVIKYNEKEIEVSHNAFASESHFVFGDREFMWRGDKELIDLKRGEVIASFQKCQSELDTRKGKAGKFGTMVISNGGIGIVDVITMTGVAMQQRWEGS